MYKVGDVLEWRHGGELWKILSVSAYGTHGDLECIASPNTPKNVGEVIHRFSLTYSDWRLSQMGHATHAEIDIDGAW